MDKRILPAGDGAIVIEFGNEISESINHQVLETAREVRNKNIKGILEIVPTFRSLMIVYDPLVISYKKLRSRIEKIAIRDNRSEENRAKSLIVPCCYGSAFGLDLASMEHILDMSADEIIEQHSKADYLIYMLGFLPGFVYLGGMSEQIVTPRLDTPRKAIPARSVGIGGAQTGVYPIESPGGWRLIGRTPIDFYDPTRKPEILCQAGEHIKFVPITEASYENIRSDVQRGTYKPEYI